MPVIQTMPRRMPQALEVWAENSRSEVTRGAVGSGFLAWAAEWTGLLGTGSWEKGRGSWRAGDCESELG